MLRYIYLLCFIITFDLVFCYNYIDSQVNHRRARPGVERHRGRETRLHKRQAGLKDRPLTQIDVASFIQAPDVIEDIDPVEYESKKRRVKYDSIYEVPERPAPRFRRGHRRPPSPNKMDDPSPAPEHLSRYQHQQLRSRDLAHSSKRKCALSRMFPFFSHNKSDIHQPKEGKTKKICIGNCSKKAKESAPSANVNLYQKQKSDREKSIEAPRIEKRYAKRISPKCKMKYLGKGRKRRQSKIVHNSRQYFANINHHGGDETTSKQFNNDDVGKPFDDSELAEVRRKRSD